MYRNFLKDMETLCRFTIYELEGKDLEIRQQHLWSIAKRWHEFLNKINEKD